MSDPSSSSSGVSAIGNAQVSLDCCFTEDGLWLTGSQILEPHHAARVKGLIAGCVLLQIPVIAFFVGRVLSRTVILRVWRLDDHLLAFAFTLSFFAMIVGCISASHSLSATATEYALQAKFGYAEAVLSLFTLAVTKLSVCVTYLRKFPYAWRGRYAILGCITFLIMCHVPVAFLTLFQCWPLTLTWDFASEVPANKCLDRRLLVYSAAFTSIFSDLWIMAVVLPRLAMMRMLKRQKLAALFTVSMGWFVIAASFIRMLKIVDELNHDDDSMHKVAEIAFWSSLERDLGIMCVCALTMRPLLAYWLPHWTLFEPLEEPQEEATPDPYAHDPESQRGAGRKSSESLSASDGAGKGSHSRNGSSASDATWEAEANSGGDKNGLDWFIIKTNSVLVTVTGK